MKVVKAGDEEVIKLEQIYSLTIEPNSGSAIWDVAYEAMMLENRLGVKVFFMHNGTRYSSRLTYTAVTATGLPTPMPEMPANPRNIHDKTTE